MAKIFHVDMLPAFEGDCFWIEYGDSDDPHRMLIDGGRGRRAFDAISDRSENLPENERVFELGILTHVDADHIEGLLRIFQADDPPLTFNDFWFNGFDHLDKAAFEVENVEDIEGFGGKQGEHLTDELVEDQVPWNQAMNGFPVVVPDDGTLPTFSLAGGATVTILSPTWPKLEKLRPVWKKEVEAAGLIPGVDPVEEEEEDSEFEAMGAMTVDDVETLAASDFKGDKSKANGSSITVVVEFDGKRILFTGDSHMEVLEKTLDEYARDDESKREFDAIKISHHGSKGTISKGFLERVKCSRYLISSNGSRHSHPNPEAIARILKFGGTQKQLFFNYVSDFSQVWDIKKLRKEFKYEVIFPEMANNGTLRVPLIDADPPLPD